MTFYYSMTNPFPQIFNLAGTGLNSGSVYIGVAGQDPITNPKQVYWDADATLPASQPLKTTGGYIVRDISGTMTPAAVYLEGPYSIKVLDKNGSLIYYQAKVLDEVLNFIADLQTDAGAGLIGFSHDETYADGTVGNSLKQVLRITDEPFASELTAVAQIQAAIDTAEALGGGVIFIPPGTYDCGSTNLNITGANVTLWMYGATLLNTRIVISATATDTAVLGGTVLDNTGGGSTYLADISGTRFLIQDVTFRKLPVIGGYMFYIRKESSFGVFRGYRTFGSNGIFVQGHDHTFLGYEMECRGVDPATPGSDDCFAIKAAATDISTPVETYNIVIGPGTVRGFTNIVGIGSEIGLSGADDPTYSNSVRNVTVTGVTAYRCGYVAYIKPGALPADYRYGLVEAVAISNCTLIDPTGNNFQSGIMITAGRGAIVRDVNVTNVVVRARGLGTSVTHNGIYIRGANQGASATIEDIEIANCAFYDNFDGVDNSGSAPGQPFNAIIAIERLSSSNDTIRRVRIRGVKGRGTKNMAVNAENFPQGPIVIEDCSFEQIGVNPLSGTYRAIMGVTSATDFAFINNVIVEAATQRPGGQTTFSAKTNLETVNIGSAAAGTGYRAPVWIAPANSWIWKIELVNDLAITQSDIDYSTFTLRNMSTASDIVSVTTKTTGGLAFAADTPTSLSATAFDSAAGYLPRGSVLRFEKADSGTGQPMDRMYAVIYYMPYGS